MGEGAVLCLFVTRARLTIILPHIDKTYIASFDLFVSQDGVSGEDVVEEDTVGRASDDGAIVSLSYTSICYDLSVSL